VAARILVIGAGAAGIAAARKLSEEGCEVVVLEARDRIGGRIWTDRSLLGFPLENGAEFVHGMGAVTWKYLRDAGLPARPHGDYASCGYEHPEKGILSYDELLLEPDFERVFAIEDTEMRAHDPSKDATLREWMKGFRLDPHAQEFALRFLAHQYLAEPEQIGIADLAHEERVYHQGDDDFYVAEGYDVLLAHMARGLDLRLSSPVQEIRWGPGRVAATCPDATWDAERVILTVPPPLLDDGFIRFEPGLPEEKRRAARALKTGPALKLHLEFREPFWDPRFNVYFTMGPISMWWVPGPAIERGAHVLTTLVGGLQALVLNSLPEEGVLMRAQQELCRLFETRAPHRTFVKGACISWVNDPWARGGYTYVPAGAHGARQRLAHPVADTLFFAGDATVTTTNPSTVHGALESGLRAAREVLRTCGLAEPSAHEFQAT
jgi:monoamine oxidase